MTRLHDGSALYSIRNVFLLISLPRFRFLIRHPATTATQQSCSMHSIGNDSRPTYIIHSTPTCPNPPKISLTIKTQSSPSRWPAPGCCLPLAGIPHCHLFITSLSQSDSHYPVDRWASSEAALAISVFHKTVFPIHCQNIWAPKRETVAAWSGCHFLSRFYWGDKEMSDMGRQLEHMKALAMTSHVTFKTLAKDGTAGKQTILFPIFWGTLHSK